jgi:alcohol dehydrogenase class IV
VLCFLNRKYMASGLNYRWLVCNDKIPVRVDFGIGKVKLLKKYLHSNGKKKIFLVSKTFLKNYEKSGILAQEWTKEYDTLFIEPKDFSATSTWIENTISTLGKDKRNIDTIVGIGGGAIMDAAKLLAVLLSNSISLSELIISGKCQKRKIGLILLPTTSGTGSEISKGSVIVDCLSGRRVGLKGRAFFADRAIIDPELSLSCSKECLMNTAFDALSHAVETYLSRASTKVTRRFSIFATKIILNLGPKIKKGLLELKEQEQLSFVSSLMGINLALSSTCLPHRISYALPKSVQFKIPHSKSVALLFPAWMDYVNGKSPELVEKLNKDLNLSSIDAITNFIKNMGTKNLFRTAGIKRSKRSLEQICDRVQGNIKNDPCYTNKKDIFKILSDS